jgi:hypothetical protein
MPRSIKALLISGACALLAQLSSPGESIAGRDVVLSVVNSETLSPVPDRGDKLSLKIEPVVLSEATNIVTLLQAKRIAPDGEAFALIYELNPTVRDVRELGHGAKLLVPELSSDAALEDLRRRDLLVLLTLDPELRASIEREVEKLQPLAAAFAGLPAAGFSAPYACAKEQTAYILNSFAEMRRRFVRRTSPPQRRATLEQLRRELETMTALLQKALVKGARLDAQDLGRIDAIRDDIEAAMAAYEQPLSNEPPKSDGLYKVVVSITGPAATSIASYRVYYTNYGLYRDPPDRSSDAFRVLGSGVSEYLRAQNYMIWAASDGDHLTPSASHCE